MRTVCHFTVPGKPATAGSKRAYVYYPKEGGRPKAAVTPDNLRQVPFMAAVAHAADLAMREAEHTLVSGAMKLIVTVGVLRPRNHFRTGKNAALLKESAPKHPISRPDSLKICRAVEDAMSGIVYRDDSQIVLHEIEKHYADSDFVSVMVREL